MADIVNFFHQWLDHRNDHRYGRSDDRGRDIDMNIHDRTDKLLTQAEFLLRDADDELAGAYDKTATERKVIRRRRNAINAACNALYRATKA